MSGRISLLPALLALKGCDTDSSGQQTPVEKDNPEFSSYVCMDVANKPWATPYDIKGDGGLGVDDMKAIVYQSAKLPPIDANFTALQTECELIKLSMLHEQVEWALKDIIAQFNDQTITLTTAEEKVDTLEKEALSHVELSRKQFPKYQFGITRKSQIVEMLLRARREIESQSESKIYGLGVELVPNSPNGAWWPLKIGAVHTASSAWAAGVRSNDWIVAVDDIPVKDLSGDGTFAGLSDPTTQLTRGFNGSRKSKVKLTLRRADESNPGLPARDFDIVVERNIWMPRHLGTPNDAPLWDGSIKHEKE